CRSDRRISGQKGNPGTTLAPAREDLEIADVALDQGPQAADRFGPAQGIEGVLDAEQRWRVDGVALEQGFIDLSVLGEATALRTRPVRPVPLQPCERARTERDHAVTALPSQRFLPGPGDDIQAIPGKLHGEYGGGRVADGEPAPVGRDPIAVRHPHAGSG